jgi:hypothetical protein
MQFYGFQNPLSGGSLTKTVTNDVVTVTDGNFQFAVQGVSSGSTLPLTTGQVSATWEVASGGVPAHLFILVTGLSGITSGEVTFTFSAGSLSTDPTSTRRDALIMGNTAGSQFYVGIKNYVQSQGSGSQSTQAAVTPAKYSGPEFSGLSAKPVAVGASSVLEGKRLNEVSSITIGGKSATFTATATELKLDVPKDLAPGLYDLVINSSAGKLTQINAVRVQGPLTALSVTTVSEGRISSEQLHEHALIAAMQQPELTKARCIVNGPNLAQAKAQAERLCALVRASNKNIETTVVESRSTVKNNSVFARVIYGWN